MRLLFAFILLFNAASAQQSMFHMMNVAAAPSWTEIRIDTRLSGTSSASTYNNLSGDPATGVVTAANLTDITGGSTGVSITTIATANWGGISGSSANNSVAGITGGSTFTGANNAVYQSIHYNNGTVSPARYDVAKPQYRFTGLSAGSYTVTICGNEGTLGFDASNMLFRIAGSTTSSTVEYDCGPGGGGGATSVTTTSPSVTCTVDGTGVLNVWCNSAASSANGSSGLAVIAAIKLIKN